MVRNYISNDIDLVQPTQYIVPKNRVAKKPPPEPEPLPHFNIFVASFENSSDAAE